MSRKPDAVEFIEHLKCLAQSPPSDAPSWWPLFVYHCTDILNACGILESGQMLSRQRALAEGRMVIDIASKDVIASTSDEDQRYVRCYLRPRTPTQFHNEGFRPPDKRELGAHCPVPVYFLLDAQEVLTRKESLFTDGNLAAGAVKLYSAKEFRMLPFDKIYHDSSLYYYSKAEKSSIIFHRNAEVLVPDCLPIDQNTLKYVWCRSPAEYQTLLNLLSPEAAKKWSSRIGEGPKLNLFYGRWTYIQNVVLDDKAIRIIFNPNSLTPGPFTIRVEVVEHMTNESYMWSKDNYYAEEALTLGLSNLKYPEQYRVICTLDDHLALRAEYSIKHSMPF